MLAKEKTAGDDLSLLVAMASSSVLALSPPTSVPTTAIEEAPISKKVILKRERLVTTKSNFV